MRLTLRTLLAYLDDTLEPDDVQALRDKLSESGFATQLVQRIRDTLASPGVSAPSPDAVAPVEEANVISEYLDSTLPTEQVAEIERACLESAPHLAEAAACHQILTMVLGRPAEVSPELRQRIYALPEDAARQKDSPAGSFSSLSIPDQNQPELPPIQDDIPTADNVATGSGDPVQPVGRADSGVSDAPTRLRETGVVDGQPDGATSPAMAGSKPLSDEASKIYGGSVRTSRITPWLVSLALAAVLLFALSRIFAPLINPETASNVPVGGDVNLQNSTDGSSELSPEESTLRREVDEPVEADNSNDAEPADVFDANQSARPKDGTNGKSSGEGGDNSDEATVNDSVAPSKADADADAIKPEERVAANPQKTLPADADPGGVDPIAVDPAANDPVGGQTVASEAADMPTKNDAADAAGQPLAAPDVAAPPAVEVAKVTSDETLLVGFMGGDQWVRLKKDMPIASGQTIICPPMFRGKIESSSNVRVTMVGPSQVTWEQSGDQVSLNLDHGRLLLSATQPNVSVSLIMGDLPVSLKLSDVDSIVALSVKYFRAPGFDPLKDENRRRLAGVLSVQGAIELQSDTDDQTLLTGQQWIKRSDQDSTVTPVESVPDWIDPPVPGDSSLEATARRGLLAILDDTNLELSLREATRFRRAEVGALAGRTLLLMGQPDTYFGGDGIFNQVDQRSYWRDHYQAITMLIDRSAENAKRVDLAVKNMDSANAKAIQRLLTGYSPNQLVEGGDEELVTLLDSSSRTVRVLALENLRRITGTTLYFRAEENNPNRRKDGIKKWQARLRKNDIR